jgi:hypothetical protein
MSIFQFPKDMRTNIQPYMVFNAFKWSARGKKDQDIQTTQQIQDSIVLPISTNGIIDSISNTWESGVGLGALSFKDAIGRSLISKVTDAFGDLGKYIGSRRGELVNDYASLAFGGTDFRSFEFSFTLMAKNANESIIINDIIKAFKRNSLPAYTQWKIKYPNFWNISIKFPGDKDIIKIKKCVLNNFTSNIFTDGVPSIHPDGTPQKIEISLSFTEFEKIDRNEYI